QGVRVMNLREEDVVSAVALVVESDEETAAAAAQAPDGVAQPLLPDAGADGDVAVADDDEIVPDTPEMEDDGQPGDLDDE
ncbi:MAG TPA: hypothetical protein VF533_23095, partial [Solirubrobacteraceae bacterium]